MKSGSLFISRGFTLIEIMVAFLALCTGLLTLLNFYAAIQSTASDAKVQLQAIAIAEQKLHELRSFFSPTDNRLRDGNYADAVTVSVADFTRSWTITSAGMVPSRKHVVVTVAWVNRAGNARSVHIESELFVETPVESVTNLLEVVTWAKNVTRWNVWDSP